jgi:hypothetical protein
MGIMLAIQGYFEGGRFISPETVMIPERKSVIVVVTDEHDDKFHENSNAKAWSKFLDAIQSLDEESPVDFERASLHREVEV